ncbi:hypothetical protein [Corallococcus sp. EGB]|uniref:hypothetical protein n=1 Tax=Corallococcus sp. EGB TaxID=1521117 RepID=UPI001CBE89E8|nr:hypothetical protein [Corallococcus sp. EGB]
MTTAESLSDVEALDAMDPWDGADALHELEDLADEFSDLEAFEAEGFEGEPSEPSGFEDNGFEAYEADPASGLYLPASAQRLVSGPAAVTLARTLNPFVLESMDADDAEAFLRNITRRVRSAARWAWRRTTWRRGCRSTTRGATTPGRAAAPTGR